MRGGGPAGGGVGITDGAARSDTSRNAVQIALSPAAIEAWRIGDLRGLDGQLGIRPWQVPSCRVDRPMRRHGLMGNPIRELATGRGAAASAA